MTIVRPLRFCAAWFGDMLGHLERRNVEVKSVTLQCKVRGLVSGTQSKESMQALRHGPDYVASLVPQQLLPLAAGPETYVVDKLESIRKLAGLLA
jgi:hypothetical protein